MMLYSAQSGAWKDLKKFDLPWGSWVWSSDSKSIYMAITSVQPGLYRLSIPDGNWDLIGKFDGLNISTDEFESFISLTADGQLAMMSDTSVVQIYLAEWTKGSDLH